MNKPHAQVDHSSKAASKDWSQCSSWPVAMLLILAAVLKAHQLATSPYAKNLFFESRSLTAILLVAEVMLGFWLLSNWRSSTARIAAICAFACFSVATASKAAAGDASCGCFGVFEVPPIITLIVDVVVLGTLSFWRPSVGRAQLGRGALVGAAITIVLLLVPVFNFSTSSLSDVGQIVGDSNLIVIDSEEWVGKQLPLATFIDGDNGYMRGDWEMILYHEDCPVCQRFIGAATENENNLTRQVFIEIPPYKSPPRNNRDNLIWCKLSDTHEWFVAAPDVADLRDGVVVASHGQQH